MSYLPTRQLWVDVGVFKNNAGEIQNLHKQGVKLQCKQHNYYAFLSDSIEQFNTCREREFFKEPMKNVSHVFVGGHGLVGCFALSIACREEYDKVYLLGYDWGTKSNEDRKTHFYQDDMQALKIQSKGAGNPEIYLNSKDKPSREIKDFDLYKKEKTEIYNVSPNSNLYQFEKIDYPKFFLDISG